MSDSVLEFVAVVEQEGIADMVELFQACLRDDLEEPYAPVMWWL